MANPKYPKSPIQRQSIDIFRTRLDYLRKQLPRDDGSRKYIDAGKWGSQRTKSTSSIDMEHKLQLYSRRRVQTVGHIMVLVERMREIGVIDSHTHVETGGAFWQGFGGSGLLQACHTSPGLLRFDKQLPTIPVNAAKEFGLGRYVVLTFGDCMLMPAAINRIDRLLDDDYGWSALSRAAQGVASGFSALDGIQAYMREMKAALESDVLQLTPKELEEVRSSSELITPNTGALVPESEQNLAFESVTSLHEALMGDANKSELTHFKTMVDNEMKIK